MISHCEVRRVIACERREQLDTVVVHRPRFDGCDENPLDGATGWLMISSVVCLLK